MRRSSGWRAARPSKPWKRGRTGLPSLGECNPVAPGPRRHREHFGVSAFPHFSVIPKRPRRRPAAPDAVDPRRGPASPYWTPDSGRRAPREQWTRRGRDSAWRRAARRGEPSERGPREAAFAPRRVATRRYKAATRPSLKLRRASLSPHSRAPAARERPPRAGTGACPYRGGRSRATRRSGSRRGGPPWPPPPAAPAGRSMASTKSMEVDGVERIDAANPRTAGPRPVGTMHQPREREQPGRQPRAIGRPAGAPRTPVRKARLCRDSRRRTPDAVRHKFTSRAANGDIDVRA